MTVLLKPWKSKSDTVLFFKVLQLFKLEYDLFIFVTRGKEKKLDLRQIALEARNAEYNPKRFAAAIVRIREPKTTALIFASGKMMFNLSGTQVCTGTKSEQQSEVAARKDFKIQNIVGSCDVKFPIRLECLAYSPMGPFQV
ncbi:hypothetical protein PRUPE_7G002500 [Prunus persica]|uniref:TATA-box binding protein n=1 Tax=Prunus persica TaxID=3760 RepID=A0A251N492_PRUPE|nr:hypothetical protein PRUPE_7G002500 [Prunus persica]